MPDFVRTHCWFLLAKYTTFSLDGLIYLVSRIGRQEMHSTYGALLFVYRSLLVWGSNFTERYTSPVALVVDRLQFPATLISLRNYS